MQTFQEMIKLVPRPLEILAHQSTDLKFLANIDLRTLTFKKFHSIIESHWIEKRQHRTTNFKTFARCCRIQIEAERVSSVIQSPAIMAGACDVIIRSREHGVTTRLHADDVTTWSHDHNVTTWPHADDVTTWPHDHDVTTWLHDHDVIT
jgi:hypothetical protein